MQSYIESLRFLNPTGEFISSPEGHLHQEVIRELNLSDKDGFEAFSELILSGFAVVIVCNDEIMISHMLDLNKLQITAIENLKDQMKSKGINYQLTSIQEDVA